MDKDPLVPKAEWQEARAKPLHLQPMVPGYQAALEWVGGAPSPYVQSPHSPLLLYQVKSLSQLSAYQERSFWLHPTLIIYPE